MAKKYTPRKYKRTFRRKRTQKRSSKYARRQQSASNTMIRKKYTKTFLLKVANTEEFASVTVSHIGGVNQADEPNTISLPKVDQDNQLSTDMKLYQFFKIKGISSKMFFPMPTTSSESPCQWVNTYSASDIMYPRIVANRLQTLATYQTGPCNQNKSISRYYNTAAAYKRFGIDWCSTSEYPAFATVGQSLYGGQLKPDQGSSTVLRVFRQRAVGDAALARLEVSYYVTYKGNKGSSSITAP